jgi:hypothetical protein
MSNTGEGALECEQRISLTKEAVEMETPVALRQRDLQQVNNQEIHNITHVYSPFCTQHPSSTLSILPLFQISRPKKCYTRAQLIIILPCRSNRLTATPPGPQILNREIALH